LHFIRPTESSRTFETEKGG